MRVALKFGYDGSVFWGYQRQPDVRTVEGDVIRALKRTRMIDSVERNRFRSASRTDRKVSAIGNVLAFDTGFRRSEMLQALNSKLEDIYFWGISEVGEDFNPRHASQRWYRYHLPHDTDLERLKEVSDLFVGEHDFRTFCRKSERSTVRTIYSIEPSEGTSFIHFDVKAQSFLWNMVRRIVSAVVRYADGEIAKAKVEEALAGKGKDLGLAPAEPLFLMDISYDFEFDAGRDVSSTRFEQRREELRIQSELYKDLWGRFG